MTQPNRHRWIAAVLIGFVLMPILLPGVVLSGVDAALRIVDRNTYRHVDGAGNGCRRALFASAGIPKFDFAVLLLRAGLRDPEALDFLRYERLENADCPAVQRWGRNNGWPPLAELQRRAAIPAPGLGLLIEDGKGGRADFTLYAALDSGRADGDFPLFHRSLEWDRQRRDTLLSALPELGEAVTRKAIVERIRAYPAACREVEAGRGMNLTITASPVGRRHEVRKLVVWACLEKEIDKCEWSGSGFTAARWMELLDTCRKATRARLRSGANLDGYVVASEELISQPVTSAK